MSSARSPVDTNAVDAVKIVQVQEGILITRKQNIESSAIITTYSNANTFNELIGTDAGFVNPTTEIHMTLQLIARHGNIRNRIDVINDNPGEETLVVTLIFGENTEISHIKEISAKYLKHAELLYRTPYFNINKLYCKRITDNSLDLVLSRIPPKVSPVMSRILAKAIRGFLIKLFFLGEARGYDKTKVKDTFRSAAEITFLLDSEKSRNMRDARSWNSRYLLLEKLFLYDEAKNTVIDSPHRRGIATTLLIYLKMLQANKIITNPEYLKSFSFSPLGLDNTPAPGVGVIDNSQLGVANSPSAVSPMNASPSIDQSNIQFLPTDQFYSDLMAQLQQDDLS
jgi:hypothetical protein